MGVFWRQGCKLDAMSSLAFLIDHAHHLNQQESLAEEVGRLYLNTNDTDIVNLFPAAAAILGLIALLPFLLLLLPGALNPLNKRRVGEDESVSQPGGAPPVQLLPSKPEFYLRTVYDW